MKTNHTPGPWFVAGTMIRKQTSALGGSFALAKVIDQDWLEHGDTLANARLIAAAPDMLEALRITRGNVASLGPAGAIEPYAQYREWLQMLDSTIDKAIGDAQ